MEQPLAWQFQMATRRRGQDRVSALGLLARFTRVLQFSTLRKEAALFNIALSTSKHPASSVQHRQDNHRLRRVCNTYRNGRLDPRSYKTRGHQAQRAPTKGEASRVPLVPLIFKIAASPVSSDSSTGYRTLLSHRSRPSPNHLNCFRGRFWARCNEGKRKRILSKDKLALFVDIQRRQPGGTAAMKQQLRVRLERIHPVCISLLEFVAQAGLF
jgi:hypothetical protein